jgi:fucose 4-O-acetylase-like acetyltransferase
MHAPGPKVELLLALSGFGIVLVVIGHAEAAGFATLADPLTLTAAHASFRDFVLWIQSFHMPLFLFVSGYLLFHATLRLGARAYQPAQLIAAKAQRLIVPYLLISSVAYPPKVFLSRYALRPAVLSLDQYVYSLVLPWNNAIIYFWFMPTLFLLFCIAPWTLTRNGSALTEACLLATGAGLSMSFPHVNQSGPLAFLNIGGVLHNFVFFALGFVACKHAWLTGFIQRRPLQLLAAMCSVGLFMYARDNVFARLGLAVAGIGVATTIASSPAGALCTRVGRHAFEIYLFSWFPQTFVKALAGRVPELGWMSAVAISVAVGIAVPVAVVRCLSAVLPSSWHFVFGAETVRPAERVERAAPQT